MIRQQLSRGRVALLFGTEKTGLSNDDLCHCHWLMRIATREQHISMSSWARQLQSVCTNWPAMRDRRRPRPNRRPERSASAGEMERISTVLLEALQLSGYTKPKTRTSTEERVRRMVRRLNLSSPDSELWLGMLRQMLWKIRTEDSSKPK